MAEHAFATTGSVDRPTNKACEAGCKPRNCSQLSLMPSWANQTRQQQHNPYNQATSQMTAATGWQHFVLATVATLTAALHWRSSLVAHTCHNINPSQLRRGGAGVDLA